MTTCSEFFPVNFVTRRKADDANAVDYSIVFSGLVLVDHDRLYVYEQDGLEDVDTIVPSFRATFSQIESIKKKLIRSKHGTHQLTRIKLIGTFDQDY